ncbi:MAG: hypothetical protein ABII79_03550 [bacterium]
MYSRLLLLILLGFLSGANAADRSGLLGFQPAYSRTIPTFVSDTSRPYYRLERLVSFTFDINNAGEVTGIHTDNSADSGFFTFVEEWLRSFRFEPASFAGQPTESRLAVWLQFHPRVRVPDIILPIDSSGTVVEADLYFRTLTLNEIHPPQLDEFPGYFCDLGRLDSTAFCRSVLIRVMLDSTGQINSLEDIGFGLPVCRQQIMSAILWARFSPAVVHGTVLPSSGYLLISFYPDVRYPTPVWRRSELTLMTLLNQLRVRFLPDTVGLMSKPVPQKSCQSEMALQIQRRSIALDTVSVVLAIDTAGNVRLRRFSKESAVSADIVKDVVERLRFYPAFDYSGHPRRYTGLAMLNFQSSSIVRISYFWLPPAVLEPPR